MSINGLSNSLAGLGNAVRPDVTRANPDRATPAQVDRGGAAPLGRPALKTQAPIAGPTAAAQAVPAEAPAGTDPTLWSVLTSEERNFFAKSAALGPLTYSRIKDVTHPVTPMARGVRLDIRA